MDKELPFKAEFAETNSVFSRLRARGGQRAATGAAPVPAKPTTATKVEESSFSMPARRYEINRITMNPGSEMLAENALVWYDNSMYKVELVLSAQQSPAEDDIKIDTLVLKGVEQPDNVVPITYWTDYDKKLDIIGASTWTHVSRLFSPKIIVVGGDDANFAPPTAAATQTQAKNQLMPKGNRHDWTNIIASVPDANHAVLMECVGGGEFKFWSAWWDKKSGSFHYAHGRIGDVPGTTGEYSTMPRTTSEIVALDFLRKKTSEKFRKGYKRVDGH